MPARSHAGAVMRKPRLLTKREAAISCLAAQRTLDAVVAELARYAATYRECGATSSASAIEHAGDLLRGQIAIVSVVTEL